MKNTNFNSVRPSAGHAGHPNPRRRLNVFRMNQPGPSVAHDFICGKPAVVKQAGVAVVDRTVGCSAPEHLWNGFRRLTQIEFALPQFLFGSFGLGNIPEKSTKDPILALSHGHDFQLNREFNAAAPHCVYFNAPAQNGAFAGGQEMPQPALVCEPLLWRNDQVRHAGADGFAAAPAEYDFGLLVPTGGCSRGIHRDDRVQRGVNDQPCSFLDPAQFLLGLFEMFIGSGQFCRSLRDPLIEFIREPLLLAKQPCFVQRKHCLISRNPQQKLFGLSRKVRPLRPGNDRAGLAVQSQPQGHDAHLPVLQAAPDMRWPFLGIVSQQAMKLRTDLSRL